MYNYDNYRKVKESIENSRLAAEADAEARSSRLCLESQEFKDIEDELRNTGMLIFRTACMGGDIAPIKERNRNLQQRRQQLLCDMGYAPDYTDPHYTCAACSDTGYVDGKVCSCLRRALIKESIRSSGIGELIEKQSFDNFNLDWYKSSPEVYEAMTYNVKCAKQYAESFGSGIQNLLLIGSTGTGKTHISTAIARRVIERGYDCLYDSVTNIIGAFEADKFKNGWGAPRENVSDKYLECDLLIVDDLGVEYSNQYTVSVIYNLLNTRQNRGLSTIISTNLSADELSQKYDGRIYSRIVGSGYTVLFFGGNDYRLYG